MDFFYSFENNLYDLSQQIIPNSSVFESVLELLCNFNNKSYSC
jgi:hypothetical protein